MAKDDWDGGWDGGWDDHYNAPEPRDVNEILFGRADQMDQHAQDLFKDAFFENSQEAYFDLVDYMWEEYGIDFEDAFTWEDFRGWYESG